jgi:NAD(P)-dependent dehydrogenase (short-subunit alcohol dehydrogenase family)
MNVIITGGSSGLGARLVVAMTHSGNRIVSWDHHTVDVRFHEAILRAIKVLPFDKVDILINCAGINSIDYLPNVEESDWDIVTTQTLLSRLRGGTVLNIVSNAARVPMTSSAAYNASKGAALMLTKQLARELGKTHGITVFSVSPNKLAGTGMSRYIEQRVCELRDWTPEQARKYQLEALPAGHETDPAIVAELIAFLLAKKERHSYLQGCDLQLGGP